VAVFRGRSGLLFERQVGYLCLKDSLAGGVTTRATMPFAIRIALYGMAMLTLDRLDQYCSTI